MTQLQELVWLSGGELVCEGSLETVGRQVCNGASPPNVVRDGELTMIDDAAKFADVAETRAIAVVTPVKIDGCKIPQIVVSDPHAGFASIVAHFRPPVAKTLPGVGVDSTAKVAANAKIHPTATICAGVQIGERTMIMPGVVVMPNTTIGADCVVHPGVTLHEYTEIGDRVTIHASTVIGANGFGYRLVDGRHELTAQLGFVRIESDVDVGASVTIDRGTYGATTIGEGTKIDNQVMIAHNCQIGRHNLLCSQVGIAGSCRTGDYVVLAGQVGLKDHITLGDHTIVGAQAGVMDDCPGNEVYLGSPATPQRDQMQIMAIQRRLPEMRKEIRSLRRELAHLREPPAQTINMADKTRRAA